MTRAALGLVRPMAPGRNANQPTPSWNALWGPRESKRVKTSLSRFVRFCPPPDILSPTRPPQQSSREFRAHLDDSLIMNPDALFAEMLRGWRAAQGAVLELAAGWLHSL